MKSQLTAIMSIVVIGAFLTSGSYAYFSGVTTSSGNVFSVEGTGLSLELGSDTQAYTTNDVILMTISNMLPGVEMGEYHIYYRNAAPVISGIVTIKIGQTGNDVLAQHIWITQASIDGNPGVEAYWARQIAEQTGDGSWAAALANNYIATYPSSAPYGYVPTLYGMTLITLHFTATYLSSDLSWAPGASHVSGLYFMLDPAADNGYIGASTTASITGTIVQAV
jgi:hypothetical protein